MEGYDRVDLVMRDDAEGPVQVAMVRRLAKERSSVAVLAVHGFSDYFWNVRVPSCLLRSRLNLLTVVPNGRLLC